MTSGESARDAMFTDLWPCRQTPANSGLLLPLVLQQAGNPLGDLRTPGTPEIRPIGIEPQTLFAARRNRIKKADPLDIAAITTLPAVCHHNMVKGTLLGATA
jgi:hypothetical protein